MTPGRYPFIWFLSPRKYFGIYSCPGGCRQLLFAPVCCHAVSRRGADHRPSRRGADYTALALSSSHGAMSPLGGFPTLLLSTFRHEFLYRPRPRLLFLWSEALEVDRPGHTADVKNKKQNEKRGLTQPRQASDLYVYPRMALNACTSCFHCSTYCGSIFMCARDGTQGLSGLPACQVSTLSTEPHPQSLATVS